MLAKVKDKIANYIITRKFKKVARIREFVNLSEAFQIGLISELDSKTTYRIIEDFKEYLQKEERIHYIYSFYYVPLNTLSTEYNNTQWKTFLCLNDINFLKLPKKGRIDNFVEKFYDIVIDLSFSDAHVIRYVLACVNARLKIGPSVPCKQQFYDIIVNMKEEKDLKKLIETILTLLIVVNQRS